MHGESASVVSADLVGAKASGLSDFPKSWVPRFYVLTTELYKRWYDCSRRGCPTPCQQILAEEDRAVLLDCLTGLELPMEGKVIVRSSSSTEGLELRGQFMSTVSDTALAAVLVSCDAIYQHASSLDTRSPSGQLDLALIIQVYVDPKATGHLSNERRVARRRQEWLYEFNRVDGSTAIGRFAIKKNTLRADSGKLNAPTYRDLVRQLRSVAAFVNDLGIRLHMEWVWDGERLWIVQGDKDPETRGRNPGACFSSAKPRQNAISLNSLVPAAFITHERWHKVQCQKDFKDAGLSTAPLWVLEDPSTLSCLQAGVVTSQLKEDVAVLLSWPIIIRIDTARDIPTELLPRSDCLTGALETEEFLVKHSLQMHQRGLGPQDFCFIVHQYIPSRSSAFCLAYPDRPRVRVDSIWGLPDGLLFYPHDSFELDLQKPEAAKKHVRFKDDYLAPSSDGQWLPAKAGRPWDWTCSATDEELALIGRDSQKLANHLGDCVQVMWFVGIPNGLGLPSSLPWWHKRGKPPQPIEEADPRVFSRKRLRICSEDDLERIQAEDPTALQGTVVRLIPRPELLRDGQFLEAVASLANEHGLPLELQGSPLHHAYYQLARLGVRIQCTDVFAPVFKEQIFGKLVRDRIPLEIERRGERVFSRPLVGEDLTKFLKAKAVEEALELQSATSVSELLEELADLYEIISSLAERHGLSISEVSDKAESKRNQRGSFRDGLVLLETREVPLLDQRRSSIRLTRRRAGLTPAMLDAEEGIAQIITERGPRYENGQIVIPLVPPDIRDATLRVEGLGVTFKVRYENKEIVIRLTREVPQVPANQLRLF